MFLYSLCRLPLHLVLLRIFHGITGGLVGPATMSVTAKQASPTQKGRVMGYYGMSIGAATLVGYFLAVLYGNAVFLLSARTVISLAIT